MADNELNEHGLYPSQERYFRALAEADPGKRMARIIASARRNLAERNRRERDSAPGESTALPELGDRKRSAPGQ